MKNKIENVAVHMSPFDKKDQIKQVLIVDDDLYLLMAIEQTLTMNGYSVVTFDDPVKALSTISEAEYAAVIADIKMPRMDGLQLLVRILEIDRELPVIMITGHGDVSMAVSAIQDGAYDFLEKPVDEDVLLASLSRAVEKRQLILENRALCETLRRQRHTRKRFQGLIGSHPSMHRLYDIIETLAVENDPILISGETGTGKELVARALHDLSDHADGPFFAVNMGAIPSEMMESELFGYEKGAFTGAVQKKIGKFEYAENGTLFLDEICSLPIHLQTKLLRVLEDNAIYRLGSNTSIPVKARIITATNKHLEEEIRKQNFRQDLYFRLNVLPIEIPPLRDRQEDIPLLAEYFRQEYCRDRKQDCLPFSADLMQEMVNRDWPGNVRELRNHVRRFCIYRDHGIITKIALDNEELLNGEIRHDITLKDFLSNAEKKFLQDTLSKYAGKVASTHKSLGISRKCFYDKVKKHKLDLDSYRKTS
ncbi:MAG: sigma-54-dependent Fis family transcriptional regulator [Desulfobulbaceae bacterium]|nr:sigma-54-dependent Fis family transcriptional regulator [Desulfobulbaceae bacterium]